MRFLRPAAVHTAAAAVRRRLADSTRPGGTPPLRGRPPGASTWCEVDGSGTVHLYSPKAEVGQGAHTVLAQLLLEELGADPERLVVHHPDSDRGFPLEWMTVVAGSTAERMNLPARRAGAQLRSARNGGRQRLPALRRRPPPPLKERSAHRLIGTSMPRVDLPAKVTGEALFASDVRLPGMLYAAVTLPPLTGAVLHGVTGLDAARAVPGVAVVVADLATGFVGAAAARSRQAERALAHLTLDWRGGSTISDDEVRAAVTVVPDQGHVLQDDGHAGAVLDPLPGGRRQEGSDHRRMTAEYRTPMIVAAPPEPPVAVVDVTADRVTVYASTQNPALVRAGVARALRRRRSSVRVLVPYVGGSFGRKHGHLGDAAVGAARLSAAAGRPVHLAWTRAADFGHGPKRPPTHHVLAGELDGEGRVLALRHQLAAGDGSGAWPVTRRVARLTDMDLMSVFGAQLPYRRIPNLQATYRRVRLPVSLGAMRSLGTFANLFAVESFMDELARAAELDPLEFRLRHLADDDVGRRLRRALEGAAAAADWGGTRSAERAQGLACCAYGRTVTAHVVDIGVTASGAGFQVDRVTAAAEGHQVNPDIARAQVEGGVVMGLSWALQERITVQQGRVVEEDLDRYHVLTAAQAPVVQAVLIDSDHWGGGMNEATAAPAAAALVNAVHELTGRRVRELPVLPSLARP